MTQRVLESREPADRVQVLLAKMVLQLEAHGVSREDALTGFLASCIAQSRDMCAGDTLAGIELCTDFLEACEANEKHKKEHAN